MSLPLFLRGLVLVLVAFAIATFAITQSWWTTLVNTALCALLLQLGYFAAVLLLIWRSGRPDQEGHARRQSESASANAGQAKVDGETAPVPGVGRSSV